jgi:hypothetical protein
MISSCPTLRICLILNILVFIVFQVAGQCSPAQRQSDSLQLIALYNATNGPGWTNTWDLTKPMTTWYGISLNTGGCVNRITLSDNQLIGNIPNISIYTLEYFSLSSNQLSGNIPNLNLPNLVWLTLSFNQLTGNIPNFNLPKLRFLRLNNNELNGSIPNFNLPELLHLILSSNQLTGSIPNFNFPNLQIIWIQNNNLSGCFPNNSFCGTNYDFSNNDLLPWQGDYSKFCNGETQLGAPCSNSVTSGADIILSDCSCSSPCATPNASISGAVSVCQGQSADLTASGGSAYAWSTGATTDIINIIPNSTTTYTVTVSNAGGCTATASRMVVVNTIPTSSISGPTFICSGGSASLTATGANTYLWNTGSSTKGINISPENTTTYTVTVTNGNGCTASNEVTVLVNPPLEVGLSAVADICSGQNTPLTFQLGGGTPPYDVTWTNGFLPGILDGHTVTIAPASTTTYAVNRVEDSQGCLFSPSDASIIVTVNPPPAKPVLTAYTTSACVGQPYDFSVTPYPIGAAYQWQATGPGSQSVFMGNNARFTWQAPGNAVISLRVTEKGCISPTTNVNVSVQTVMPPACVTTLTNPADDAVNVPVNTALTWPAVSDVCRASGYRISLGTTPGGNQLVSNLDLGNTVNWQPPQSLPSGTKAYVRITP